MKVADGIFTAGLKHQRNTGSLSYQATSHLACCRPAHYHCVSGSAVLPRLASLFTYPRPPAPPFDRRCPRRSRAAATAAILAFALSGCNGTLPALPTEVWKPVPVPCIAQADIPTAMFATDAELAALDDGQFVFALARDRLERQGHISALEAVLQACAEKSPVSGAKTTPGER